MDRVHVEIGKIDLSNDSCDRRWSQEVAVSARLPDGSVVPILSMFNIRSAILDITEENSGWTHGFTQSDAVNVVNNQVRNLVDFFESIRFPIKVYRGVRVPPFLNLDDVDIVSRAGKHWTTARKVAQAFADGRHQQARWRHEAARPVLLSGRILEPRDVDWKASGSKYLMWSAPRVGQERRDDTDREDELHSSRVADVKVIS